MRWAKGFNRDVDFRQRSMHSELEFVGSSRDVDFRQRSIHSRPDPVTVRLNTIERATILLKTPIFRAFVGENGKAKSGKNITGKRKSRKIFPS